MGGAQNLGTPRTNWKWFIFGRKPIAIVLWISLSFCPNVKTQHAGPSHPRTNVSQPESGKFGWPYHVTSQFLSTFFTRSTTRSPRHSMWSLHCTQSSSPISIFQRPGGIQVCTWWLVGCNEGEFSTCEINNYLRLVHFPLCLFLVGHHCDNALRMAWDGCHGFIEEICLGNCNHGTSVQLPHPNFSFHINLFTCRPGYGVYRLHHSKKSGCCFNRASFLWWCWRILRFCLMFFCLWVGKLAMGKFHLKDSNGRNS